MKGQSKLMNLISFNAENVQERKVMQSSFNPDANWQL